MEIKNKIPIHIGLFGHIDSGKTAIAAVLSEIISTAGLDAHPQSKQRGITIDLGFTSFILDKYLITLVDGPGHADLIKISASSVEIIDFAMVVIDINKGPQIQTGEHLIMIDALGIKKIIVLLNKIDIFEGNINEEIKKIKAFFNTTNFGSNVPVYAVSAKKRVGFELLKNGILETINSVEIKRDYEEPTIIPIDHYFSIKGMGTVVTGTIIKGKLEINQNLEIIPLNISSKVKNIQIFRQNVKRAKAGDRVGVNVKFDVDKIYRGCYATTNPDAFNFSDILEIKVNNNKFFKHKTNFGTQVHVIVGMFTSSGTIYPFYESDDSKKIKTTTSNMDKGFKAFLWLNEKVLLRKQKTIMLISRLDLPPTGLRILGSAELIKTYDEPPILFKIKVKKGIIQNPNHSQGIICTGLAQSADGAKHIVGKKLEPPFTKVIDVFATKGAVIVGLEHKEYNINKGDKVILKELRNFRLKKI